VERIDKTNVKPIREKEGQEINVRKKITLPVFFHGPSCANDNILAWRLGAVV
jgi:hypothetical protein